MLYKDFLKLTWTKIGKASKFKSVAHLTLSQAFLTVPKSYLTESSQQCSKWRTLSLFYRQVTQGSERQHSSLVIRKV